MIGVALDGHPIYVKKFTDRHFNGEQLDICHGKLIDNQRYAYFLQHNFPYIMSCFKGSVDSKIGHQEIREILNISCKVICPAESHCEKPVYMKDLAKNSKVNVKITPAAITSNKEKIFSTMESSEVKHRGTELIMYNTTESLQSAKNTDNARVETTISNFASTIKHLEFSETADPKSRVYNVELTTLHKSSFQNMESGRVTSVSTGRLQGTLLPLTSSENPKKFTEQTTVLNTQTHNNVDQHNHLSRGSPGLTDSTARLLQTSSFQPNIETTTVSNRITSSNPSVQSLNNTMSTDKPATLTSSSAANETSLQSNIETTTAGNKVITSSKQTVNHTISTEKPAALSSSHSASVASSIKDLTKELTSVINDTSTKIYNTFLDKSTHLHEVKMSITQTPIANYTVSTERIHDLTTAENFPQNFSQVSVQDSSSLDHSVRASASTTEYYTISNTSNNQKTSTETTKKLSSMHNNGTSMGDKPLEDSETTSVSNTDTAAQHKTSTQEISSNSHQETGDLSTKQEGNRLLLTTLTQLMSSTAQMETASTIRGRDVTTTENGTEPGNNRRASTKKRSPDHNRNQHNTHNNHNVTKTSTEAQNFTTLETNVTTLNTNVLGHSSYSDDNSTTEVNSVKDGSGGNSGDKGEETRPPSALAQALNLPDKYLGYMFGMVFCVVGLVVGFIASLFIEDK